MANGIYDLDPKMQERNRNAILESIFSPRYFENFKKHDFMELEQPLVAEPEQP